MMKLKAYLKSSARRVLPLLNLLLISCTISGCFSSDAPTYLKENIDDAIRDISRNEYKIDVKVKLVGRTLWIYLPLEDIFEKSDKPEKFTERFAIENNNEEFQNGTLKLEYLIKTVPEQEKYQDIKYNKAAMEKINNVWKVIRRVLFSMERLKRGEPQFFCIIIADTKNGLQMKELFYIEDLKKVSYEFISWGEYQHRTIQDTALAPEAVGDKEGTHIAYKDIAWEEFIAGQIQHRIKMKFGKPEVPRNADVDKEILKVVVSTLKIYGFKDFSSVEMMNLLTNNKVLLNRAAVWARPSE